MIFLAFVYNEAERIRHVLDHAVKWAKEAVLLDKGSTDGTLEICKSYGDRVRVIPIPYSERGHEDYTTVFSQYATDDWVFYGTCSEIPTRKLIEKCQEILAVKANQLDLIYVPRLMYFFGLHRSPENGGVCYYPFLFHKDRALISNDIHDNFHARDPSRTFRIPYAEDCCVHHLTHPSVRSFWLSSMGYFTVEVQKDEPPDKAIRGCFKNIEKLSKKILLEGESWLPLYCALASYELGKALSIWEKASGPDRAVQKYGDLSRQLIAEEWDGTPSIRPAQASRPFRLGDSKALKSLLLVLAKFPYFLVKISFLFRRFKIRED